MTNYRIMELPTMSHGVVTKLLVTLIILWLNLDFSIGDDYSGYDFNNDNFLESLENQTGVDWFWESVVVMRWDIDDQPVIRYNDLQFDIDFTVSDYVNADQHVRYTIYQDAKCLNADNIITDSDGYMNSWVTEDNTPRGMGLAKDARRTITVSNQLIPETITQSKSYTEADPETGVDASITYCVRFSLWSNGLLDSEATEINHVAVTIALVLDLTDDNVSISGKNVGALEEGVETTNDEFFLESFICDKQGNPIVNLLPFQQGQVVRVCVQPTEQASEVGFRMKEIETFIFTQGAISQPAVLNGAIASNQLTDLYCEAGSSQCAFETILFAHFYDIKQGLIVGNGDATLQWGGEGVDRRLQVYIESLPLYAEITDDDVDDDEFWELEEDQRFLQERTSIKSMAIPDFTIKAENGGRPPLLNKSMARTQKIVLVSLLVMFSVVFILPLVYCYVVRDSQKPPPVTPTSVVDVTPAENEPFETFDRFILSEIPEDRTITSRIPDDRTVMSVKSLFSRASRVSNGSKRSNSLNVRSGYATE